MDKRFTLAIEFWEEDAEMHLHFDVKGTPPPETQEVVGILEMAKVQYINDRALGKEES